MAIATKERVNEVEASKTFKTADTQSALKEYHYMQRTVGMQALPDGTITSDMLDVAVMGWLNSGYKLAEVHYIGQHKGAGGEVFGYVYGYHFIKE